VSFSEHLGPAGSEVLGPSLICGEMI